MHLKRLLPCLVVVAATLTPWSVQAGRPLSPEDWYRFQAVSDLHIAPDGVSLPRWAQNQAFAEGAAADVQVGITNIIRRPVTAGKGSAQILPPCNEMMLLQIARPRPLPS